MADNGNQTTIPVEFKDTADGLRIEIHPKWSEVVSEHFSSFRAIRGIFRWDASYYEKRLKSFSPGEEPLTFELRGGPGDWEEDRTKAAEFLRFMTELFAQIGLQGVAEEEYEAEAEYIDEERFLALTIRQSAFFEDYLKLLCQLRFQEIRGRTLTKNELKMIKNMRYEELIRLSHLIGILDETQHGDLQNLRKKRGEIAHKSWTEFDDEQLRHIKGLSKKMRSLIHDMFVPTGEPINTLEIDPADIGLEEDSQ